MNDRPSVTGDAETEVIRGTTVHPGARVAVVTGWFPSLSETFVMNHATGLMDLGVEVDLYAFKRGDDVPHRELRDYGLLERVTYLPEQLRDAPELVERMVAKRYAALHAHFGMIAERVAFLKPRMPDTRMFVTFHGLDVVRGLERGGRIYRQTFANFDAVVSICRFNRMRLLGLGCPAHKLLDLPNGVDTRRFELTPRPLGQTLRIVTNARLHPDKDLPFALRVMQALDRQGHAFTYTIIGDGPQREALRQAIADSGLQPQIRLAGACAQDEVIRHLAGSDIFFLPSRTEAFPVALLEAQAMGLPVVCTEVGGTAEAVAVERSGFLVPSGDVASARDALGTLLSDRSLLVKMGQQGRDRMLRRFDARQLSRRCARWYGLTTAVTDR